MFTTQNYFQTSFDLLSFVPQGLLNQNTTRGKTVQLPIISLFPDAVGLTMLDPF